MTLGYGFEDDEVAKRQVTRKAVVQPRRRRISGVDVGDVGHDRAVLPRDAL